MKHKNKYIKRKKFPKQVYLHALTVPEILLGFNFNKLKLRPSSVKEYTNGLIKPIYVFVSKVVREAFRCIINDIIENGVEFRFPESSLGVIRFFIRCEYGKSMTTYKNIIRYKHFDELATNFKFYKIVMECVRASGTSNYFDIAMHENRYKRIAELANTGKLKLGTVKDIRDYFEVVHDKFPNIELSDIECILKYVFQKLVKLFIRSYEISIEGSDKRDNIFIGLMFARGWKALKHTVQKTERKVKYLCRELHKKPDGYGYFSINRSEYEAIKDDFEKGKEVDFGRQKVYTYHDLAFFGAFGCYAMFKVNLDEFDCNIHWSMRRPVKTAKAELVEIFPSWNWDMIAKQNRNYDVIYNKTFYYRMFKDRERNIKKIQENGR